MEKRLIDANDFDKRIRAAGGMVEDDLTEDFKGGVLTVLDMLKTHQTVFTIPENPTNGDIIKALFPNAEIFRWEDPDYTYVFVTIKDMGNCWKIRGEWWDAPYKEI